MARGLVEGDVEVGLLRRATSWGEEKGREMRSKKGVSVLWRVLGRGQKKVGAMEMVRMA